MFKKLVFANHKNANYIVFQAPAKSKNKGWYNKNRGRE